MAHEIASFVFFDIETTGLPWQEKNQTKITELSFVVASRRDILNTSYGYIPPVSKLTFVFNPRRPIHPVSSALTGLTNEKLRDAPVFKQKVTSLLVFLDSLPKPVCLVAHNGNSFDFKILLAECSDAGALLPEHLLCVDSLMGFRKLLKGKNTSYNNLREQKNSALHQQQIRNNSVIDLDDLLTDDEDEWPDLNITPDEFEEIDDLCLSLSNMPHGTLTGGKKKEHKKDIKSVKKARSATIKNVFNKNEKATTNTGGYTLTELYKRLLNKEEANAHRAEADCFMLLQCVVARKEEFIPWADSNCKKLKEIKPLVR